ncbi:uncharacterized protein LOC144003366 isoform X2 [Festucalex cinctus]
MATATPTAHVGVQHADVTAYLHEDDEDDESSSYQPGCGLRTPRTSQDSPNMDGLRLPPLIEEVLDSRGQLKEDMCEKTPDGEFDEEEEDEEVGVEELRVRMVEVLMELEETRQNSRRHEENFLEMRSMLEDERAARAQQAETFSRQTEALKAELTGVRRELAVAVQEKWSELEEAQAELRRAEEEALALQETGEEAAAERENDIACLQEELCRLRAQLQHLRDVKGCHGGDRARLEEEFASLSRERLLLSEANQDLSCKVRREEQAQPATEGDAYISLCHTSASLPDIQELQVRLQRAEDAGFRAQSECEHAKRSLGSLQRLHDDSRHECAALEEELRRCKAELLRLQVDSVQRRPSPAEPPLASAPLLGVIVIVALMWCWWEELAS